ncbi:TetR family transcriptional regulator [Aminobacter sp. DSM 101952]|uniref:TetR/AcrR family transcriptional regulator n=1 Tax=Aminobacter sp. DSM 101952 TaxID=2735891 RepID=UPI0006FF1F01|nr:TetR/AcrR family transcriptional regulator [Aminobacter sp. DSM 101952]KQU69866.1 TetR family transcriptional regulator [Aminobacter sp. DSM 101952]
MSGKGRPRSFDRDEALRQAMLLFWQKGYDGASLAELTAAMGINSPSLYAAFGCKEALFREAVDLYSATEGIDIWGAFNRPGSVKQAVADFLRASARAFSEPGDPRGCLIVLGALNASETNREVFNDLSARRLAGARQLEERLKAAAEEGELPAAADPAGLAAFIIAVQQGMSVQARDGVGREALLAVADGAMAAWDALTGRSPAA